MSISNPGVSIIILNWNGWRDTLECLDSVEKITYPNYEVIIVDNGSTDKSLERIKNHESRIKLKIIENKENLGFAGGNNAGIKHALENGADYVLLLNNDTLVEPDFLERMAEIAEGNEKFGLVGAKIYFYPSSVPERVWYAGGKINWLKTRGSHLDYGKAEAASQNGDAAFKKADYITGCCLLIKRAVIEKVGMLSDDYFLYYEDTDYCLRAKSAGWDSAVALGAHIWHKVSRSTKEFSPLYLYYHARNGLLMAKKNSSAWKIPAIYFFGFYLAIKQILKYFFIPQKREWAIMTLRGISDFYNNKSGKLEI